MKKKSFYFLRPTSVLTFIVVVIFYTLLGSNQAHAYRYTECWGDILKWTDNDATMKRLPISFPDGSNGATAITTIESRWNGVPGSPFEFDDDEDNDDTWEDGGDGNEVGRAYSDDIDGALGLTLSHYDWCGPLDDAWPGHNMPMEEADVMFNGEDFCWSNAAPNPRRSLTSGGCYYTRLVALHEFGHALGLSIAEADHEDRGLAAMNSQYPSGGSYPGTGSHRAVPHGDDRRGVRAMYGGDSSSADIGVLNFAKVGTTTTGARLASVPTPTNVCPGDTITVKYNYGNLGNVSVDFDLGFYLSTDTDITTSDILVASPARSMGVGRGSYAHDFRTRTLTIPDSVSFNTDYYVGIYADYNDEIDETRESNNRGALPGSIHVRSSISCP